MSRATRCGSQTSSSVCGMLSPKMFFISTLKRVLTLRSVLVDQRLEARIFAQRIPGGIELEHWDSEAAWDDQQMIEEAKCFIRFTSPSIDLGQRLSCSRSIKSVLRFRQQFDGPFAF